MSSDRRDCATISLELKFGNRTISLKGRPKTSPQNPIARSIPFVNEIKDSTAGSELETRLNEVHGPGSPLYDDLAHMITDGVRAGWAANVEADGAKYRSSRIGEPIMERTASASRPFTRIMWSRTAGSGPRSP